MKILSMVLSKQIKFLRSFNKSYSTKPQIKLNKTSLAEQTINYVKVGEGAQPILCFPGALGTIWSDFKPQIDNLDKSKFTIVAWDPPGYGSSRPPNRSFTPEFYKNDADMAYQLMTKLGFNNFSLLGWSDGGISSIILAAEYPQAVDKLVIWGANSYVIEDDIQSYEKIRNVSKWSKYMRDPLVKLYTEKGLQDMWSGWCDTLKEIYTNGGNICIEHLKEIACPTLILHGDNDPMVGLEHPLFLKSNIKGAILKRFPEGKHNIHLKYADEFNKIVSDFLLK